MRFATQFFLVLLMTATSSFAQYPQTESATPAYRRQTLTLAFGTGLPPARNGQMAFWNMGASGSAKFLVNVSKSIAFGIGIDGALLNFNERSFRSAHPVVAPLSKDMMMANVYIAMKWAMMPSMRFSPFVGVALGATHLSEAVYEEIIDSVRISYYNIPQHTRLTIGLELGADIYITQWLAFDIEAKTNYVHNDPDFDVATFLRGGFRFTL